jgi:Ran GTPase-activating protein (RanGAP) involved in mRNA processing and transport
MVELDLSTNLIGDRGARAIGKFLNNHSQLVSVEIKIKISCLSGPKNHVRS